MKDKVNEMRERIQKLEKMEQIMAEILERKINETEAKREKKWEYANFKFVQSKFSFLPPTGFHKCCILYGLALAFTRYDRYSSGI